MRDRCTLNVTIIGESSVARNLLQALASQKKAQGAGGCSPGQRHSGTDRRAANDQALADAATIRKSFLDPG